MKFFQKKPKPDVMGFICCETSLNRCRYMMDTFKNEELCLITYLYSTAMIQKNLQVKYSDAIIEQTMKYTDKFFVKKYKKYKDEAFQMKRDQILPVLENDFVASFLHDANICDQEQIVEKELHEWNETMLLISDDIKSM